MSARITIDGREIEVAEGTSVLAAARQIGIDIPTLCFLEKLDPATSCLVCLVKLPKTNRLVPSCATKVVDGMVIESESEEVRESRRTALELLLSDHVGDCLSPCHRICPMRLEIPLMIRQIESDRLDQAIGTLREAIGLPGVLGRLCNHPCENGCRRATHDEAAAIRDLERYVADADRVSERPFLPERRPTTGKKVAVVGSGPAGLSAAYHLLRLGHDCTVFDRHPAAGGSLRSDVPSADLPAEVLDFEIRQLERLGAEFKLNHSVTTPELGAELGAAFDAVLIAAGAKGGKATGAALGVATTATGVKADPGLFQTSKENVFAVGSAVRPVKQIVRAMSEGQAAAECLHQFLAAGKVRKPGKPFSSMMGRLETGEVEAFLKLASPAGRIVPALGSAAGLKRDEAVAEAQRCLHCDCRAAGNCRLQTYASLYGADFGRFPRQRRPFEQHLQHERVIFEPGKCILCGICVQLTERAAEPLGLTFVGRGFDVRIGAGLNRTISDGLQRVAEECVAACPTGALAFNDRTGGISFPPRCQGCDPALHPKP